MNKHKEETAVTREKCVVSFRDTFQVKCDYYIHVYICTKQLFMQFGIGKI
jgi:hypothetical protein